MRFTSFGKSMAAVAAMALPALPFGLCLMFRLVEAWKIWDEMNRLSLAGVLAWLWAIAFLAASAVTIFHLGTRRNLGRWEILIDAANTVMTALLALECADQHPAALHALGYGWQVVILFLVFLIPQFTVTFAARQARDIARRLRTCLPWPTRDEPVERAVFIMRLPPPRTRAKSDQSTKPVHDAETAQQNTDTLSGVSAHRRSPGPPRPRHSWVSPPSYRIGPTSASRYEGRIQPFYGISRQHPD